MQKIYSKPDPYSNKSRTPSQQKITKTPSRYLPSGTKSKLSSVDSSTLPEDSLPSVNLAVYFPFPRDAPSAPRPPLPCGAMPPVPPRSATSPTSVSSNSASAAAASFSMSAVLLLRTTPVPPLLVLLSEGDDGGDGDELILSGALTLARCDRATSGNTIRVITPNASLCPWPDFD